jgi:hypothetical protein
MVRTDNPLSSPIILTVAYMNAFVARNRIHGCVPPRMFFPRPPRSVTARISVLWMVEAGPRLPICSTPDRNE